MSRASVVLGVLLAASLLCNAVSVVRLSREASPSPARAGAGPAPGPRGANPAESVPPASMSGPVSEPPGPRTSRPPAAVVNDPQVLEVLEAQESFRALWKELDRVFKARSRLEEGRYLEAVFSATTHYLQLAEPARSQFTQAAREASQAFANARKERDAVRKTLPPKDKADPQAYAAYQQQKDAIDARYDGQIKGAVDGLRLRLDAGRPRHTEFLANADKWLKNVAPKAQ